MNATIERNFSYHPPKAGEAEKDAAKYDTLRGQAKDLAYAIEELCPAGREKSMAMTNLEQSLMWAIASLARPS